MRLVTDTDTDTIESPLPTPIKLFELISGRWVPRNALTPQGAERLLDGVRFFEVQQAAAVSGISESLMTKHWIDVMGYPMMVMAAHTGARRSEMMRARTEDVDLANAVITLREKKRARGRTTIRRVPVSKLLADALRPLVESGNPYLFGDGARRS